MSLESLKARVAALEKKLGTAVSQGDARKSLIAEINGLEKKLGCYMDDDDVIPGDGGMVAPIEEPLPVDDLLASDDSDDDDDEDDATTASLKDPSGIEEEITQDRFTEVEGETHGEELASAESMEALGRQVGHKQTASEVEARLKKASARLDVVADYLEKHGRRELAYRIDKIADAIDIRINGGKK